MRTSEERRCELSKKGIYTLLAYDLKIEACCYFSQDHSISLNAKNINIKTN